MGVPFLLLAGLGGGGRCLAHRPPRSGAQQTFALVKTITHTCRFLSFWGALRSFIRCRMRASQVPEEEVKLEEEVVRCVMVLLNKPQGLLTLEASSNLLPILAVRLGAPYSERPIGAKRKRSGSAAWPSPRNGSVLSHRGGR